MSGGHWNYKDTLLDDEMPVKYLPQMLETLKDCFHEVDYTVSGDYSPEESKQRIFDAILKLGDSIWGE